MLVLLKAGLLLAAFNLEDLRKEKNLFLLAQEVPKLQKALGVVGKEVLYSHVVQ